VGAFHVPRRFALQTALTVPLRLQADADRQRKALRKINTPRDLTHRADQVIA
jgi:hypothetical protein